MEELRVPLVALRRGAVQRSLRIEDPSDVLGELPLALGPIDVDVEIDGDPREGVRARGRIRCSSKIECRRCLTPVPLALETELDAWFRPGAEVEPGEEGVWPLDVGAGEVDLLDPLREELWVAAPEYVECSDDCRGLCARCGSRLGHAECDCRSPEPDPRWEALRTIQTADADEPGEG